MTRTGFVSLAEGGSDSTVDDVGDLTTARRGRAVRRLGLAALVVLVTTGLLGWLDPRGTTQSSSAQGWALAVDSASVMRPGVPTRLAITVEPPAGRYPRATVVIAISRPLLDRIDFQSWQPSPSAETGDPSRVLLTWDVPADGRPLTVVLDARMQPNERPGRIPLDVGLVAVGESGQAELVVTEVRRQITVLP